MKKIKWISINNNIIKSRLIVCLFIFLSQLNVGNSQNLNNKRNFIFLERYHFPIIPRSCEEYTEELMLKNKDDFRNNVYFERYIIFQIIKNVIGNDAQISFKCVEEMEGSNSDDPQNIYAGKFGSNPIFYLEDDNYYMSVPSLHYENFYVQSRYLKQPTSQNMFEYLNYLFYLGIFLIPAITGIILLLMKDLNTFYDYQKVVYNVFRYFNRQGDQQMNLWMNKILAIFVAIFFFFHYSILLSEMTALRRFSLENIGFNINSYREVQNSNQQIDVQIPKYYFLSVDSFQYHFIKNDYEVSLDLIDPTINHYNVQFNKNYFSKEEYNLLRIEIIQLSMLHQSNNQIINENMFSVNSLDIYMNWITLGVVIILSFIYKLFQMRFSSLNSYTEIKSYRDRCNQEIACDFGEMFRYYISQFLVNVQAKDHYQNFKQVKVSKKLAFLGKQVFKIVQKRRKRNQFKRKQRYQNTINIENDIGKQPKQNLYQVIKQYIELDKKGKTAQGIIIRNDNRRFGIQQAGVKRNTLINTNGIEQFNSQNNNNHFSQFANYQNNNNNHNNSIQNENNGNKHQQYSFNSLQQKSRKQRLSIGNNKLSSFNKLVGQNNLNRRMSQLLLQAVIPQDSPLNSAKIPSKQPENRKSNGGNEKFSNSPRNSKNQTSWGTKNFSGFAQALSQASLLIQDNSSKNRRVGTDNILNPIQLKSLIKYDQDLARKNRRHSSYIETVRSNGNQNDSIDNANNNNHHDNYHNNEQFYNQNHNSNNNNQQNHNQESKEKSLLDYNHDDNNTIQQQQKTQEEQQYETQQTNEDEQNIEQLISNKKLSNNHYKNGFKYPQSVSSPHVLEHSDIQTYRNQYQTEQDSQTTDQKNLKYLDSNRIELLLTEERTSQNQDLIKTSVNFNDHFQKSPEQRFSRNSPQNLFNNYQRDTLYTEDDLLQNDQIIKLQNIDSIQSDYIITPMKINGHLNSNNGFHKQ